MINVSFIGASPDIRKLSASSTANMSNDLRTRLADIPHRLRDLFETLPARWNEWREAFRQDPAVLWAGPIPRIAGIIVAGTLCLILGNWLIQGLRPAGPAGTFAEPTPFATIHVACTNPDCLHHETRKVDIDFDDWPMTCDKCGRESVYRAKLCRKCRNWYATAPGASERCPHCQRGTAEESAPTPHRARQPANPDDLDDPW